MRRTIVLITVAAVMLTTMALSGGSAFAQGNPSCFGAYARSTQGHPGPGAGVSALASDGAAQVAEVLVPFIQQERPCPITGPFVP